jgi:NitT/TauT family transport system substrate-binding protein
MKTAVLMVALVAAGLSIGCHDDSKTGAVETKVTLQLNWKPEPQFGGFYVAPYANHGLRADVRAGGASAPTVDMLAAGTVPFAIVSGDEILIARSRGKKIVALFAIFQTHPQGIMCRASRGFTKLEDVFTHEGTLAIEQGLGYSEFLKRKYGFDKLKIVPTPFGDLSFIRNDEKFAMQCFVTSEPIAAKKLGLDVTTFLIADSGYNPYATVLATNEDYLEKNRATCAAMVAAVREGWRAYLDDPSSANATMEESNPTMDAATFASAAAAQKPLIETDETKKLGLGCMTESRWKTLAEQLVDLKVIDKAPPAKECFRPLED